MDPTFVHLHLHSEYSLIDGLVRIKPLVKTVAAAGMPAVAVTDQGNLFSLVRFYKAAVGAGVKPIAGADLWVRNPEDANHPHRLVLLAQDEPGYRNLTRLISRGFVEGQHLGVAQVERDWVLDAHQGLIALSGGLRGDVAEALLKGRTEVAEQRLDAWLSVFGDRYYLELMRTGRSLEGELIEASVDLAGRRGVPVVATNDVRFLAAGDFEAHEARVCIHQGRTLDDPRRPRDYSEEQYLRTPAEMAELFADLPEALENTVEIAKRCNLELKLGKNYLPVFPVPEGMTTDSFFAEQSRRGLVWRLERILDRDAPDYAERRRIYDERLKIELDVIIQMGFPGYFLIVADFIQWAKDNGIPVGPGRGSGAGSLVAYALKITDLDPIEHELLFERFLNPERVSMPDFDIDFCMEGRDRVIDYVARKYGREAVSQIITFGTMAAKAVVRDVGRVMGHPYGFVDKIAKMVPFELGMTLEKALKESEDLKRAYEQDEEVRALLDMARKLEGLTRNAGKHAGGVVIAPTILTDFAPLYCEPGGVNLVTQFDKDDVEQVGLVKFDFLGLRTLTIIDWALKTINAGRAANGEPPLDIERIDSRDQDAFDLLKRCETTAVFQLESRGMKELIKKLQPDCFDEITALVALFRPGPLQSGMVDDFIERKHGRAEVAYPHPDLEPILKPTYGIILYQEQVMQIAQVLAGYSLGGADILRRCLAGSTEVVDAATGRRVTLTEIAAAPEVWIGREVFALDLKTQKIVRQPIAAVYHNGVQEVFEVTTRTGRRIQATATHLFYTLMGWKPLGAFQPGDRIGLAGTLPIKHDCGITDAQIKLTAYLLGDGHLSTRKPANCYFCNSDPALIADFNRCVTELFGRPAPVDYQLHPGRQSVGYVRVGCLSEFNAWIDSHIQRAHSHDKVIPDWVDALSRDQLRLFIGTLWSTDGTFDTSIGHADYTSTSRRMIEQLQHLLLRLGIVALFNIKTIQYQGQPHRSYRAQITGREEMLKFYDRIQPFLSRRKQEKAEICYRMIRAKASNQSKHTIPAEVIGLIANAKYASGMTWAEIDQAVGMRPGTMSSGLNFKIPPRRALARHRVLNFATAFQNEELRAIADSEVFWDVIESIRPLGQMEVFDLTIPEHHNFIANDFIAHNCMGKKKPEEMAKQRDTFEQGALARGIDGQLSSHVFNLIEYFSGYGFNKTLGSDTLIVTLNGVKRIVDCGLGDQVISMGRDGKSSVSNVVALHDHGRVPLWEVEFDDGAKEQCTLDHKWLTCHGQWPLWKILETGESVWGCLPDQVGEVFAGSGSLGVDDSIERHLVLRRPVRATFVKLDQGYDLEVDHPEHNFLLASGLCCSNSHSAAYALVSYQTLWLKAHYPAAFMAAVLSADMDNTDKVVTLIDECRTMKLRVEPPAINRSDYHFTIADEKTVVYGLGAVKGVGESAIEAMLEARRAGGHFRDLWDFCGRIDLQRVNRRVLESLVRAGALDELGPNRATLMAHLPLALKAAEQSRSTRATGQVDLFGALEPSGPPTRDPQLARETLADWEDEQRLQGEKETLGLYLTGHPIDRYEDELKAIGGARIARLLETDRELGRRDRRDREKRTVVGLVVGVRHGKTQRGRMGSVVLDDRTGRIEATVFSELYEQVRHRLVADQILSLTGALNFDEFRDAWSLRADSVRTFEEARALAADHLILTLDLSDPAAHARGLERVEELRAVLLAHRDTARETSLPIRLIYRRPGAVGELVLGKDWRVQPADALLKQLRQLLGAERVRISYERPIHQAPMPELQSPPQLRAVS